MANGIRKNPNKILFSLLQVLRRNIKSEYAKRRRQEVKGKVTERSNNCGLPWLLLCFKVSRSDLDPNTGSPTPTPTPTLTNEYQLSRWFWLVPGSFLSNWHWYRVGEGEGEGKVGGVGVSVQDGNEKARPLFAPLMGRVGVLPEIFAMPRHFGILVLPLVVVVIVPEYPVAIKITKRVLDKQG